MRSDERRDIITLRWRLLSPRDQENIDVASWLSRLPGRKSIHVSKERRKYSGNGSLHLLNLRYNRFIPVLRLHYDAGNHASIRAALWQCPDQVIKLWLPHRLVCT